MSLNTRATNETDIAIGARVRAQRQAVGMTQQGLGDVIGVTFQQVQKYERGANRISGVRLSDIAKALRTTTAALLGEEGSEAIETGLSPEVLRAGRRIEALAPETRAGVLRALGGILQTIETHSGGQTPGAAPDERAS